MVCHTVERTGVGLKGLLSSWLGCQLDIYGMGGMRQSCEVTPVCYPEGGMGEGSKFRGSEVPTYPVCFREWVVWVCG